MSFINLRKMFSKCDVTGRAETCPSVKVSVLRGGYCLQPRARMGRGSHRGERANEREGEAGGCGRHGQPDADRPVRGTFIRLFSL